MRNSYQLRQIHILLENEILKNATIFEIGPYVDIPISLVLFHIAPNRIHKISHFLLCYITPPPYHLVRLVVVNISTCIRHSRVSSYIYIEGVQKKVLLPKN